MGLLYEDFHKEREDWKKREREMSDANREVKEKLAAAGAKVDAYEDQLGAFEQGTVLMSYMGFELRMNDGVKTAYAWCRYRHKILRKICHP